MGNVTSRDSVKVLAVMKSTQLGPTNMRVPRAVLPNLFSTATHFIGTAHETAHCIYGTYFIYKTCILCIICRPILYIHIPLLILNDKAMSIQYTEHSLIIMSTMFCV